MNAALPLNWIELELARQLAVEAAGEAEGGLGKSSRKSSRQSPGKTSRNDSLSLYPKDPPLY